MENRRIDFDRRENDRLRMDMSCGFPEHKCRPDGLTTDDFYIPEAELYGEPRDFADPLYGGMRMDDPDFDFFPERFREGRFPERFREDRLPDRFEREYFFPDSFDHERLRRGPDPETNPKVPECCPERDLEQLRKFMDSEACDIAAYRRLSCRLPRSVTNALLALEADERRHLRRLRAAYYLLTCCKYNPCCPEKCECSICEMLRNRYADELASEKAYLDAAKSTCRADLAELYRAIAAEENGHAKKVVRITEVIVGGQSR